MGGSKKTETDNKSKKNSATVKVQKNKDDVKAKGSSKGSSKESAKESTKESSKKSSKEKSTKETVEHKESKESKESKSDKGDKKEKTSEKQTAVKRGFPNNDTEEAGLFFNVNTNKNWMKEFYSVGHEVTIKEKDKNEEDKYNKVQKPAKLAFKPHWCLAATDQVICTLIVNAAVKRSSKGVDGLYTVTETNVVDGLKDDRDLRFAFLRNLDFFDRRNVYTGNLKMTSKNIGEFIEKYCAHGASNVHADGSAINIIAFLMLENRKVLADTAYMMVLHSKGTSVSDKSILYATQCVYNGTSFANDLYVKVGDVSSKARKDNKNKTDVDSEDKPVKTSSSKKTKKDDEDDAAGSDDGSDAGSDDGSDAGSDDGSDAGSDDGSGSDGSGSGSDDGSDDDN